MFYSRLLKGFVTFLQASYNLLILWVWRYSSKLTSLWARAGSEGTWNSKKCFLNRLCLCWSMPVNSNNGNHTAGDAVGEKVKCTLIQTLRLSTGRAAHRGSRCIALPFLDHSTRRGWGVSVTPRPLFTPPRERPDTHCTGGWVGPRAGLDRCGKSRSPPGFEPRIAQPVASGYTDYTTPPVCSGWFHSRQGYAFFFNLLRRIQTGSGAHWASSLVGTEAISPGLKGGGRDLTTIHCQG
jgi:hypothetical protein